MEATTITDQEIYLNKPPCCMTVCPSTKTQEVHYLVIGTYNLVFKESETAQQRDGSLLLFRIVNRKAELLETLETPFGILDVEFRLEHRLEAEILGAATSTGSIALFRWGPKKDRLSHIRTLQLFDKSCVVTSLAWQPWQQRQEDVICCSLSTGEVVAITSFDLSCEELQEDPPICEKITKHSLEAWTVAFHSKTLLDQMADTDRGIFSGGDDGVLQFTSESAWKSLAGNSEEREAASSSSPPMVRWNNKNIHEAGVTAILPLLPRIVVTGSYDDHIRILETTEAGAKAPVVLAKLSLEGGVWRLKLVSTACETGRFRARILVSCMYMGAYLVQICCDKSHGWDISVLVHFTKHDSMCYACDFIPSTEEESIVYISCSFYDKKLCLWRCQGSESQVQ